MAAEEQFLAESPGPRENYEAKDAPDRITDLGGVDYHIAAGRAPGIRNDDTG